MPLKIGNKALPKEMYGMVWAIEGESKRCRFVVPAKGVATLPYIIMLFASPLGQKNRADYTSFLVSGVIRWCPRACWNKCTVVPR